MRVLVAGGSGAIGFPLIRILTAGGHQVTAVTRTPAKERLLSRLGATPAVADALDPDALRRVVMAARPTHVIHQLTALPRGGPKSARDLEATNRLRIDGTRNLIAAAVEAGAVRIVGGSFALLGGSAIGAPADVVPATMAMASMEAQILEANGSRAIEGIVLRYGLFYGPDAGSTMEMVAMAKRRLLPAVRHDQSLLPCIHVDDAAGATVAALAGGMAGACYDIVDDQPLSFSAIVRAVAEAAGAPRPFAVPSWLPRLVAPYRARMLALRLPLSNERARLELGWRPSFPTLSEGLRQTLTHAA
jgi:nucleoside-diphosphate-sugar epimerase